jgi:flavin-dependent dehydrogenase
MTESPVVVIGAGPQGLAAAAHLLQRGLEPPVVEAGDGPGAAIAEWPLTRSAISEALPMNMNSSISSNGIVGASSRSCSGSRS